MGRVTQADIVQKVRAELERGDIPFEVVNNNTIEARGVFITTVVLVERSIRGNEYGRVRVFVDGYPLCGFGFATNDEAGDMSNSDGLGA